MATSPVSGHVDALHSKHAGLDARLAEELARPQPDAGLLQDLKKQKLRIKEELSQL